jgi:hypothetical protein
MTICIGCGCDEDHACVDINDAGCSWIREDQQCGVGVCSACPDEVDRFDAGGRTLSGFAAEVQPEHGHFDDDDSSLILPGDDDFDETLELLD